MELSHASVRGHDGEELPCRIWRDGDPDRAAVVLPGAAYSPDAPLLWFARLLLLRLGWAVFEAWWDYSRVLERPTEAEVDEWVTADALAATRAADDRFDVGLVVGKSLGTRAMAQLGLRVPGIWLTPILSWPPVPRALQEGRAPALVVLGTADPVAPAELVDELRGRVELVAVEGADHALQLDDPAESIAPLQEAVEGMRRFVESL